MFGHHFQRRLNAAWTANFPPPCRVQLLWYQCSIGHRRSRHSPYLGISLPVWTSDFPPYPLPMPSWTANFPPLCRVRLSWSQWSIGHWHSRHSPHLLISIPVWRSDFPPFPLQCPSGQLISCHTAYSTFNFRVSMLDWTLAFPPFSAFECPHGQPISRYYFPNTTTATIINTTEQNHPFDSTTPVSNTCKYGHNSARHWW